MNKALRKGNHKGCPYVPLASLGRPRPHRAARSLGEMNWRRNGNPKGSAPQPQPISEGCPYVPLASLGRPRPHRAARSLGEMNPRRNGNPKGSAPQPQPISEGCPYTPAARLGSIVGAALVAALSDMGSAQ